MSKKDVDVSRHWPGPLAPIATTLKPKGSKETFTGYGWDKKQADKAAGEKMRRGEADR